MTSDLATTLLRHLDAQLASARRLLELVLSQGSSIRERDSEAVLARVSDIQAEMVRRSHLELERLGLLTDAGRALAMPAAHVTLESLTTLVTQDVAAAAHMKSATLRGLLLEIAREHGINRALMRQELSFLSHLIRQVGGEPEPGYRPMTATRTTTSSPASPYFTLDLQA